MQLFNSTRRIQKHRQHKSSTETQSVQFLLGRMQSGSARQNGGTVLLFTSANSGEGVSHVVQFFAEKLAKQTGKPSLVVNAEQLGSLRVTDLMDMPGMSVGNGHFAPAESEPHASDNTNGNGNGNGNGHGASLDQEALLRLESETGLALLRAVRGNLGYTLIDCPSISSSHEAAMLAPDVDGVVVVVEADRTKRDQILRAAQTIKMARGNLMGLVLNRRRHVVPERLYRRL